MLNDADEAKQTPKIKGLGSNCISPVIAITTGVIIIAVAVFEETSVMTIVTKYISANRTYGCISRENVFT